MGTKNQGTGSNRRPDSFFILYQNLFGGRKIFLADTADFTNEIIGEVFPLGALLVFVIFPAADIANVYHDLCSFLAEMECFLTLIT
jgi:hypothetical protein